MRRIGKLRLMGWVCAAGVLALLLVAVLAVHLTTNHERVREAVISKVAQTIGGQVDYERLTVSLFPAPHVRISRLKLEREGAFGVLAKELAAYPAILPALIGRIRIRRLILDTPVIRIQRRSANQTPSGISGNAHAPDLFKRIDGLAGVPFNVLTSVSPGTEWRLIHGRIDLTSDHGPAIRFDTINATVANHQGQVALQLSATSTMAAIITVKAAADQSAARATGHLHMAGLNLPALFARVPLPMEIITGKARAEIDINFELGGPDRASARFDASVPQVTIARNGHHQTLDHAALSGVLSHDAKATTLELKSLKTRNPALALSAAARLFRDENTGQPHLALHAEAPRLEIETAGNITRAITGAPPPVRNAFRIARSGVLNDADFTADLIQDGDRWAATRMGAASHLENGHIVIVGIDAPLEQMQGDVVWAGHHAAFTDIDGHFAGVRVEGLGASIDWAGEPRLSIETPNARVDAAVFYPWLTGFDAMAHLKQQISAIEGTATLSRLTLDGPLKHPRRWDINVTGSPDAVQLSTPQLPFPLRLSGGEIAYDSGKNWSQDINIRVLDGNFTASHEWAGSSDSPSLVCRIDGSAGPETVAWMRDRFPVAARVAPKPPVTVEKARLTWDTNENLKATAALTTADGVHLDADVNVAVNAWQIHELHLRDGHSAVTLSATGKGAAVDFEASGQLVKDTVDRLTDTNQVLSGRIGGHLVGRVDLDTPLATTLSGTLMGDGVHLALDDGTPVDIERFEISGSDKQIQIREARLGIVDAGLTVTGSMTSVTGPPTIDLTVDADHLDAGRLQRLFSMPNDQAVPDGGAERTPNAPMLGGTIHLRTDRFTAEGFTWSPLSADITIDGNQTRVQVDQAMLCGINTTGWIAFTPDGISLHLQPAASGASLQETTGCLLPHPIVAQARFDLIGDLRLPPTREEIASALTGQLTLSSTNGRIAHASVLMKILAMLNLTEVFTGGKTDLVEDGFGYASAVARATIENGRLKLNELLLDGNSLKLTGRGEINMIEHQLDISLLAAPLKTVDRIVGKIPIIRKITGGTLLSLPIRIHGSIQDPAIVPLAPSTVSEGLLNLMKNTVKTPFELVESATDLAGRHSPANTPPADPSGDDASAP